MWVHNIAVLLLLTPCLSLRTQEPPPPTPRSRNTPVEGWVDVRLNHFMAYNTDTFKMRYYYNNEFLGHDYMVIFIGGEWEISPGWTTGGLAYELADRLGAGLFYTEHRFYGETRPFPDTNTAGLRFLTVDQAMADLAQFIEHIKSEDFENGRYRNAKVALVGCSYAGSMATWMRLAYPHLVTAAFSDSGPLLAKEDFSEYLERVAVAIEEQGGEECLASIEAAMDRVVSILETNNGPADISQLFNTCTPIDASEPLDVATFFWFGITEAFAYLVQYAQPGDSIPSACGVLTNPSVINPEERLANWITSQPSTEPCIETRYSEVVARHAQTYYNTSTAIMRLWTYQTCVEFGWYQTTTSDKQPFLKTVPLEYFHQMCKDFFSTYFDEDILQSGIDRTNLFFGGGHLPDRVVTVLGGHDPWTPMGPNESHAHHLAPLHLVPEISHCMAIQGTGASDNEELEETKKMVIDEMLYYMWGLGVVDGATSIHASIALLLATTVYILL